MAVMDAHEDQRGIGPWSAIPRELIEPILKRLEYISDYIKFGAVCRWWRSILHENYNFQTPLLLLPAGDHGDPTARGLLDPTTNKLYKIPLFPEEHNQIIVGSSFGWLVNFTAASNYEIELFNPITRAHILLPPATEFNNFHDLLVNFRDQLEEFPIEYFIRKAIMFSNPNSDCVVMAIHGMYRELGYCRIGDKTWTSFPITEDHMQYHDTLYHKGSYYAVTQWGILVVCEFDPVPKVTEIARLPPSRKYSTKYLVELSNEILLVSRYFEEDDWRRTSGFVIYKLTVNKWEEVTCLDDQVLFLGNSRSMSISMNEMNGYRPNQVYFVDDDDESLLNGFFDMGVYDLEYNKSLQNGCIGMGVYDLEDNKVSTIYSPSLFPVWPMFWITPSL